jgi:hypothetical protein
MCVIFRRGADEQCKGLYVVFGSMFFNMSLLFGFVGILKKGLKSPGGTGKMKN